MATIVDDTKERVSARPLLIIVGTCSAYLMVATEAVVMGKVYDHHATENLQDLLVKVKFSGKWLSLTVFRDDDITSFDWKMVFSSIISRTHCIIFLVRFFN